MKTYLLLRLADIVTTYILITHYQAVELNSLMGQLINYGWIYYLLFQWVATVIIMLLVKVDKLWTILNILSGLVVINNLFCILISL